MYNNLKINDKIISISNEGELIPYHVYTIKEIYKYHNNDIFDENDCTLSIDGLLWAYHKKNFISISEYRNLKLRKIERKYEER